MSDSEIVCLVASAVTIALAGVAIWLSVHFFHMTSTIAESTKGASEKIGASVERLEKLFDRLYSDTFSMMRETVSDMRKHMWPETVKEGDAVLEETEKRAADKIAALKKELDGEIGELLERQKVTNAKVKVVRDSLHSLVDRAITESRKVEVEAREETVRESVISVLREGPRAGVRAEVIVEGVARALGLGPRKVIDELERMEREKIVSWETERLGPASLVRLEDRSQSRRRAP